MVCRERHVPSGRVLGRTHLHDARVVEQAGDRKPKRNDFRRGVPHAPNVRQVANNRYRVLAPLLDAAPHLVELLGIAPDQNDRAMICQFERGGATYAGCRARDDVRLEICGSAGLRHN
jgi:hypothetical protein